MKRARAQEQHLQQHSAAEEGGVGGEIGGGNGQKGQLGLLSSENILHPEHILMESAFDHDQHMDDVDECLVDGIEGDWCVACLHVCAALLFRCCCTYVMRCR